MSWPKAHVIRCGVSKKVTVWGCKSFATDGPLLAIEIQESAQGSQSFKYEIIKLSDVVSVNWECAMLLIEHGIDCPDATFDGFGADVKQNISNDEKTRSSLYPCRGCNQPYSLYDPDEWVVFPPMCKQCRKKT